jgi:TetR/AcrR family transcriptional regulator
MISRGTNRQDVKGARADLTRARILQAAIVEFSAHGMAGARTEAIAKAAKVNKALLYYYFKSKEDLYTAALLKAFSEIRERAQAVLDSECSAGERLLRTALNHFDGLAAHREPQSLMQQEMVRFHRGESVAIPVVAKTLFAPMLARLQEVVEEGVQSGELCAMDWFQVWCVALGSNIFYFLSGPTLRLALPFDPLAPAELKFRRKAILQFLSQALFVDRRRGERFAKRILADTPMPIIKKRSSGRKTQ